LPEDTRTISINADCIRADADRIRLETMKLVAELRGRRPNSSQLKRVRDLQRRRKAHSKAADAALTKELAVWMALKERLDREPREDDEITSEDERRASQIVSAFWLEADR
jgi:hypothetical protein